jgi:hypothetical protein
MRTKLSKLALAATLGIALAFAFTSCSDDKDGGTGACRYTAATLYEPINGKHSVDVCKEALEENKSKIEKKCEEEGGEYYDSCPSGSVKKCKDEEATYYIYSNEFKDIDCDEFLDKW